MAKPKAFCKQYSLNESTIDAVSEEIVSILTELGSERKMVQRFRLSIEESLFIWMKQLGKETELTLEYGKKLNRRFLRVAVKGKECNPYSEASKDFGSVKQSMLTTIGLIPDYSYKNSENTLTFYIPHKEINQILILLLIIFASALVGLLGKAFLPEHIIQTVSESLIAPVEDTVFRVLSCIAGPMIFLSVAWGVYGIGDVYTLGKVGKKLMLNIMLVAFSASVFAGFFYPLLGPAVSDEAVQNSQFGKFFEMLLNIFPSDVFSPFINGNTLQIIFLAFIIGLSLIFLGQRTSSVAKAVEQINHIINFLMTFVSKLVPYFVFIVLVRLIWSDNFSQFMKIWQLAVVFLLAQIGFIVMFTLFVAFRQRVSPFYLIKSGLPSYLIALSTASSSATFESNVRICQTKLGVTNAFTSFGVPFSTVLFKPSTAIYYTLFCFTCAKMYDVKVSFIWILITVVIAAISSLATPPIPGGAAATYTVLFLQLGIPAEALAIAVAVDMIADFVITSGDMYLLLLEVFHVSGKLNMRKPIEIGEKK